MLQSSKSLLMLARPLIAVPKVLPFETGNRLGQVIDQLVCYTLLPSLFISKEELSYRGTVGYFK